MNWKLSLGACLLALSSLGSSHSLLSAQSATGSKPLDKAKLAVQYYGNDAPWYLSNVPFFEIDDPAIQRAYYYRWQVYRSHLRDIGSEGTDVTEFLPSVPWARHPYEDLNDSSPFHIAEGRWLRDPAYVNSLVDHLYSGAGNDRHFSEWIAAATLGWVQVTGDSTPAVRHLDAMRYVYNLWDDHLTPERNLYWIEPLLDATEYTISSIDASGAGFDDRQGGNNSGFTGGFAYRPSINAYQFGNAKAIATFAQIANQTAVAEEYNKRAEILRAATLSALWNPNQHHFTDIYQRSTKTVKAGEFIRGRELVGLVPWMFDLPPADHSAAIHYESAWKHVLDAKELAGPYGLRTAEPSYARYMTQYRYDKATELPECQWNGPSWPFQSSEVLTAMSNLLHNYTQTTVNSEDYLHLLRQYAAQHRRDNDHMDLQEDYNPDTGKPIVGLPRSHHYNHSTYVDLVLSGLVGIRPTLANEFVIKPLLPAKYAHETPIHYFAVQDLSYHGHALTILYDEDGSRYHQGTGLTVFADGKRLANSATAKQLKVVLPAIAPVMTTPLRVDLAVNVWGEAPKPVQVDLPIASASSTSSTEDLYQAIDGRLWFFPEIPHGWSPSKDAATQNDDWYSVDLRQPRMLRSVELAFFDDHNLISAPEKVTLQAWNQDKWIDLAEAHGASVVANGITTLSFQAVQTQKIRVVLHRNSSKPERLISLRAYSQP